MRLSVHPSLRLSAPLNRDYVYPLRPVRHGTFATPARLRVAAQGIMVLGSGVYRIGNSVEFDYCTVRVR